MKVLKFGGTSVGTVESLRSVKKIVENNPTPVIVVVSALGGLTDRLITTARKAAAGDESYRDEMLAIAERHHNIINEMVSPERKPITFEMVDALLEQLGRNYDGVFLLRDLPSNILDIIVSFGERMSSVIVTAMIDGAARYDSLDFIKTENWFSKNIADQKLTTRLIKKEFAGFEGIAIVPGFISTDKDTGAITNLGRGGSDFTAALIAAALDASILEIWTDVNGFMSADPRIIPEARVMPYMTFIESMELCSFGAKVIYPPTIYPVFHKNIPIKILNTFCPEAPGTLITDRNAENSQGIKGVTSIKGITLFTLNISHLREAKQLRSRALNALSKRGITVLIATREEGEPALSFAVASADAEAVTTLLSKEFAPELSKNTLSPTKNSQLSRKDNVAVIAVVGEGMRDRTRLAPRILNTLQRDSIHVASHTRRASATTLTFVIDETDVNRALQLIHSLLF